MEHPLRTMSELKLLVPEAPGKDEEFTSWRGLLHPKEKGLAVVERGDTVPLCSGSSP